MNAQTDATPHRNALVLKRHAIATWLFVTFIAFFYLIYCNFESIHFIIWYILFSGYALGSAMNIAALTQRSVRNETFYSQVHCLILGLLLTISYIIIRQQFQIENPTSVDLILIITEVFNFGLQLIALIFLSPRFRLFCIFFISCNSSIFISNLLNFDHYFVHPTLIIFDFILLTIFAIAWINCRLQKKLITITSSATPTLVKDNPQISQPFFNLINQVVETEYWEWDITNKSLSFPLSNTKSVHSDNIDLLINNIHPCDLDRVQRSIRQCLRGFNHHFSIDYRIKNDDHSWKWIHVFAEIKTRDEKNHATKLIGVAQNAQQHMLDKHQLQRHKHFVEHSSDGFFTLDAGLNYTEVNQRFCHLIGYDKDYILAQKLLFTQENQEYLCQQTLIQLTQKNEYHREFQLKLADRMAALRVSIYSINNIDQPAIYVGILSDRSVEVKQKQRLSYLETHDALTDLPNRNLFNNQLHQYLMEDRHNNRPMALFRINIDRFRYINGLLNNKGGDELLQLVARRLRQTAADSLLVARLNNDDFAIIYELNRFEKNVPHVRALAKQILTAFEPAFLIHQQEFNITLSIGISLYPDHGRQFDTINNHAEQALLTAKKQGGNSLNVYDVARSEALQDRLALESDLRKALISDQLVVYYQPKMGLIKQKIVGFEALVRWQHPQHGLMSPSTFVPLAEETGLILPIGKIVMQQVAKQLKQWQDMGLETVVSINVVAQQILRGTLVDELISELAENEISAQQLEIEITESSFMDDVETVNQVLTDLRQRGFRIALDDFGTGYSSLAYLADYPIDIIKVDRSFVSKIGSEPQQAIVSAIIAMAKAMNKLIIAEGVETIHQERFLIQEGCQQIQGFLISKAVTAEDATLMLKSQ